MASTPRPSFYNTPQVYQAQEQQGNALQKLLNDVYEAKGFRDWRKDFTAAPLLTLIKQGSTNKERITWDYIYGSTSVPYYSDYTAPVIYSGYVGDTNLTGTPTWERKVAELGMPRSMYSRPVTIESLDQQAGEIYGNPNEAVKNLLGERILMVLKELGNILNGLIYGNSAESCGLEYFFDPTLLEYAKIPMRLASYTGKVDQVDYFSQWRPLVGTADYSAKTLVLNDAGTAAATSDVLEVGNLHSAIEQFDIWLSKKGRRYTIMLANPDTVTEYARIYRQQVVINIQNGQKTKAEIAMEVPTFKGRTFYPDPNVPANTIYFLDLADCEFLNLYPYSLVNRAEFYNPLQLAVNVGGLDSVGSIFKKQFQVAMLTPRMIVRDMSGLNKLIVQA